MTCIRFQVYEYDLPSSLEYGGTPHDVNKNAAYHDTGKQLSINESEAKAAYYRAYGHDGDFDLHTNQYIVPNVLLYKLFKFSGNFVNGFLIYWTKSGEEGYIAGPDSNTRHWHLKRIP